MSFSWSGLSRRPPYFEEIPGTGQILEGSDVYFECRIRGNPTPRVVWTHKGVPVTTDYRLVLLIGIIYLIKSNTI